MLIDLIEKAKRFNVSKKLDAYIIESKTSNLGAIIIDGNIKYYITDAYNSSEDWLEIDLEHFQELVIFCNRAVDC